MPRQHFPAPNLPRIRMLFDLLTSQQKRQLRRLRKRRVPCCTLQLVALCWLAGLAGGGDMVNMNAVEFFAGQCAVTNALNARGIVCAPFEYHFDPVCNDIMSRCGFCYSISLILRLGPGSMIWFQ